MEKKEVKTPMWVDVINYGLFAVNTAIAIYKKEVDALYVASAVLLLFNTILKVRIKRRDKAE